MEKNKEASKSEKEIDVIDLTINDKNIYSSTNSCVQTEKRKQNAKKLSVQQHIKKQKYNCRKNTLKDIVKKTITKKILTVPFSENVQHLNDNAIKLVECTNCTNDLENAMSNISIKDEIQVIPATSVINLNNKDVNVFDSKSKANLNTFHKEIMKDNIMSVVTKDSEDLDDNKKELPDTINNKHLKDRCEATLDIPKTLKENVISTDQLSVDNLKIQLENIQFSVSDPDISTLITTNSNGETVCHFYWWDAYENTYKEQDAIYLFGKVYVNFNKTYNSCCLRIKHALRRIYLLPTKYFKDPCNADVRLNTMDDVRNEFNELAKKLGIKEYQSHQVWKKCIFEKGVSNYTEYLEIRYPIIYPAIDPEYTGSAIDKVFETTISPMQLLFMERNIKGPCWLDIKCPIKDLSDTTWCKLKLLCTKMENISVSVDSSKLPLPPAVIATLNVRTYLNAKTKQKQIIMVTILLQDEFYIDEDVPKLPFKWSYCLITKPNGTSWPPEIHHLSNISYSNVIKCRNESDLLQQLLQIIEKNDPDLYIGYDCSYQLDTLLHRMFTLQIADWSRLGKLKHFMYPVIKPKVCVDQAISGRPICDIKVLAKELNIQSRSCDFHALCTTILRKTNDVYKEIQPEECSLYYITKEKIEDLIKLTFADTLDILLITFELNIIPLAVELTCITGHILSKTLSGGQIEKNEFLLLHAFHSKNYILPDMKYNNLKKRKSNYKGGLVLTPKKGLYTTLTLLMDYVSLYPSIIIEYNLCFSTVPGAVYTDYKDLKIPEPNVPLGIIPTEISKLTKYRQNIRELMNLPHISSSKKIKYNMKQIALKLMTNSMYGCLGTPHCRFYAKGLAALITSKGREILLNTKLLIENMKYEVIYGDTDSVMIKTNILEYNEAISIGNKIKQEVNKLYKNIKLNSANVFQYLLLLKKKKYAAVEIKKILNDQIELSQIYKGIEIVRKDWCPLAAEVEKDILNNIFSNQSHDMKIKKIYMILQNVLRNIRENQISLSSLVISKQLSKNLDDYCDKEQSHIQVAKRLNRRGGKIWRAGDVISYVMCKCETDETILNGAYHIDEIKENNSLEIDMNYYLKKQILPVVLNICEPIMELDRILLAKNLDLSDVYGFEKRKRLHTPRSIKEQVLINVDKFKHCIPITFRCTNKNCKSNITITGITSEFTNDDQLFLNTVCPNNSCRIPLWKNVNIIYNELQLGIRQAITIYYSNQLKCKSPLCSNIVTKIPLQFYTTYPKCYKCKESFMCRRYTETNLFNQIYFYYQMFDISNLQYKFLLTSYSEEVISVYNTLRDVVVKYMKCTSYLNVDFNEIFQSKSLNHVMHSKCDNISLYEYGHMDDEQL